MALFNYASREITAKIVYYGPGVCGKTTSLQYIHERISPAQRGRLLSLATETDRTIFFDLLPLKLGEIGGFKLRFQLYTVPGQVKYNKTRKLVLQGADAVVFVADSQINRREANIVSFQNLRDNLQEQNRRLEDLPLVYEYNKRDMNNVLSIDELNKDLNPKRLPFFEAVATKGVGVMETLEAISKFALSDMEQRLKGTSTPAPAAKVEEDDDDELLRMMQEEPLVDLTEAAPSEGSEGEEGLSFSSDELDALELESDLSSGEALETKPIGYDKEISVEEVSINEEAVAQTGTLKESEFFNLKDLEEQALRELDAFLDQKDSSEESFDFDAGDSDLGGLGEFEANEPSEEQAATDENAFDLSLEGGAEASEGLDFSFSASPTAAEETDFAFGTEDAQEETTFGFEREKPSGGADMLELDAFSLGDEGETPSDEFGGFEAASKGGIESLNISDGDLDFPAEESEELPAFTLDEGKESEDASTLTLEEEFGVAESDEFDRLKLGGEFGESFDEMPSEEGASPMDFRITDSVRFEMQVGEDISKVTPFEEQLDQLSGDMLGEEEEARPQDEFQPDVSETSEEEQFQVISDEWTRLIALAKHLFQRAETLRAQHAISDNIAAVFLYYAAVETAVKAVASKYESCNPAIAAFHLMLESIEEETEKPVAGAKSLLNNIVAMKNRIQLEAGYPDDEECELAARISERFLTSLAQDFLTVDFVKLSSVLPRSEDKGL